MIIELISDIEGGRNASLLTPKVARKSGGKELRIIASLTLSYAKLCTYVSDTWKNHATT